MDSTVVIEDRENLNDFLEEAELQQYYGLFRDILKVTKVSQLKFVLTEDLVQIGLSRPEQRRYKKIYTTYFPNPYISKIRKMLKSNKKRDQNLQGQSITLDTLPVFDNNVKIPTKHIISIEDITINKELGMGQFGVVQQGTWTTGNQRLQVAIKCLGHERMTSNSTEFLKEAAVMHSIEHPNIVRLYGVVLHLDSLMLVTELAPLRSLLECLREVSLRLNFPVPNLCEFAEQICDGMTYLESKRLIHRDLAARNILVFNKDRVKISDFGLSRALGVGKDYYQTNYNVNLKLPVAWCAPECILFLRFTSASDVWAFGVCLWEMFTYGFQPWAAFSGQQILEAIDAPNFQRLERPECCPEAYYTTMLECWAHDFNNRPKFKDLGPKLRSIRPEQVQAIADYRKPEEGRRNSFLEYKSGQIITVLGKENMTKSPMWYGVLPGCACGMFDPSQMKAYTPPEKNVCHVSSTLSPHPIRHSARSIRSSLLRSDVKRHTYTGKRTIQRSMISSPQGDVKHTGHVGLDGAYFGDISFLDPAGCPPRQIVTPYKPSEDLEQVPLINPNSPSHLTGATGTTPYPMLASNKLDNKTDCDVGDLSCDTKTKSLKKTNNKLMSDSASGKSILNKVRCATIGRSHKVDNGAVPKPDEVHEYHEISDNNPDAAAGLSNKSDHRLANKPENLEVGRSTTDFSQSLLDEMESMFRKLDSRRRDEPATSTKNAEQPNRSQTLTKSERKKGFTTSTMKPMSAHDEKTLNTAVALANEITSKSMNDLGGDKKLPQSPSDRSKFHFKFPLSLHHGSHAHEQEKEKESTGRMERRNFSEEAKSVPDLQSTITAESKLVYTSLVEEPTPSTSLMPHLAKGSSGILKPATIPKPTRGTTNVQFQSMQNNSPFKIRPRGADLGEDFDNYVENVLPLPPRATKPKLVDMPRHIRKYPLKILEPKVPAGPVAETQSIIYQNTKNPAHKQEPEVIEADGIKAEVQGVDVMDGVDRTPNVDVNTNPFTNAAGPSHINPFSPFYGDDEEEDLTSQLYTHSGTDSGDDESIPVLVKDCKDHVSVEDLLEFADQKPCGRQRGVESDEVRIMSKVLKSQATPEECLEALELCEWDVHNAIKLVRVRVSVGSNVSFAECNLQLKNHNGDIVKAITVLAT